MQKPWYQDRIILTVYAAILLLGTAYGITTAIMSLFFTSRGIGAERVGRLASLFALGIGIAAVPAGAWVRRSGARMVLLAALTTFSICLVVLPTLRQFPAIAGTRVLDGASSAATWVACETLLLARAPRAQKARVMSVYAVCFAMGYILGPALAHFILPVMRAEGAFRVAAVLAALAAVVVVVAIPSKLAAAEVAEDMGPPSSLLARDIARRIKMSLMATFSYGYFQSSLVVFLPLELVNHHNFAERDTFFVVAAFAGGMLVSAPIVGRLGDRFGQLRTMRVLAAVGMCMVVSFIYLQSLFPMCVACFVAGCTLATLSPLSLALQGQVVASGDLPRANGLYNAAYAAGMLLGPALSGMVFASSGPVGGTLMLMTLTALWAVFVLCTVLFAKDDPTHPQYVPVAET